MIPWLVVLALLLFGVSGYVLGYWRGDRNRTERSQHRAGMSRPPFNPHYLPPHGQRRAVGAVEPRITPADRIPPTAPPR